MKNTKEKTAVRQIQIINAALDTIAIEGLKGLTIASIAKKVGIANSNIYRHFSSREAIIDTIITKVETSLNTIKNESFNNNTTYNKCLEDMFFKHIEFLEQHRGMPRIVFSEEMYSNNNKVFIRLRHVIKEYAFQVKKILALGIKNKEFDPNIDVTAAAMTFLGFIQSIAMQWVLFNYSFSPIKRGKQVWHIYTKGIRCMK